MKQVWQEVLFAHWPVSEASLSPYIPAGLELQHWDGTPWISVVPFVMDPLLVRGLPRLPWVHRFLELNIRTYVTQNSKPGVLFLNMDASSRLAASTARTFAYLPYKYAEMSLHREREGLHYNSRRPARDGTAIFDGVYSPTSAAMKYAQPGTLLYWLTERYCLYAVNPRGQLYIGDIHHFPWPLQEARLQLNIHTSTKALGLVHDSEPSLLTYTPRLEVLLWPLRKV